MAGRVDAQRVDRVLAHLMRNEQVAPEAIERAVTSAVNMELGQSTTLTGDRAQDATLRRVFVQEQTRRLER